MTTMPSEWLPPPTQLVLDRSEVHIWRVALAQPTATIQRLWYTLQPDECERAKQFHFAADCARFIVARGLLRAILGRYLGIDPGRLHFCYNQYGKPALAPEHRGVALSFNLSHSHELALYAIACSRAIGVDIEYIRAGLAETAIAEQFFSPHEVAMLRALPTWAHNIAFFNCWTRKEAYIKARGEGLSLPLNQFDVSLVPGAPTELLDVAGDQQERSRWTLQSVDPGSNYVAALAVEGQGWILRRWQLAIG
jgi:4'-phosphopantetheinyl transferase